MSSWKVVYGSHIECVSFSIFDDPKVIFKAIKDKGFDFFINDTYEIVKLEDRGGFYDLFLQRKNQTEFEIVRITPFD